MIWCDPHELLDYSYHVHPLYCSPASYQPTWHATKAAIEADFDLTMEEYSA